MPEDKENPLVALDVKQLREFFLKHCIDVTGNIPEDWKGIHDENELREFVEAYSHFEDLFRALMVKKEQFFSRFIRGR